MKYIVYQRAKLVTHPEYGGGKWRPITPLVPEQLAYDFVEQLPKVKQQDFDFKIVREGAKP